MKVSYVGAFFNSSGYSDAARNYVMALTQAGVDVEVLPVSFENFSSDLGWTGEKVRALVSNAPQAKIRIIHTVPGVFEQFARPDKYNIGYTVWETSKLPKKWVEQINALDEVWVPSQYNYEIFKSSGVRIPVFVIPHTFNREVFEKEVAPISIPHVTSSGYFSFYSTFQWTQRKNPLALLKAYFSEFRGGENVILVLKTYLFDPTNLSQTEKLKKMIGEIKDKMRMTDYPKLLLISNLLSKGQVNSLHKTCHCYVSAHMSEGWGIPISEAAMAGNPIICTNYSGSRDFVNERTGFPVHYQLTPVYDMPWEAYDSSQEWADIDILDLRRKMRWVYENRTQAKRVGMNAQKFVDDNLSWAKIGELMKNRLEAIGEKHG